MGFSKKTVLDKLKRYQAFWNLAAWVYRFVSIRSFKKLPKNIFLDVTNACNLRCPVCPTHFYMKRPKGFMDLESVCSIIDQFKPFEQKPDIYMHFSGEPILHPKLEAIVAYAARSGHRTHISTNATTLDRNLSKRLIEAGLHSIDLCLDGFSKEAHESYRIGSSFNQVKNNIEGFLETKRELDRANPEVFIQTLLTSFSENQMEEMKKWAQQVGADAIKFKSLSMGSVTTPAQKDQYSYLLPSKIELRRKSSSVSKTLCPWPLESAVVYWNGDLGLCCVDYDGEIKMPNIEAKGFIEAFTSSEAARIRKKGVLKGHSLCRNCSLGNADFVSETVVFERSK
jgi:MoaA/NifB/PqqE/SkfB family radical SAM enzyme